MPDDKKVIIFTICTIHDILFYTEKTSVNNEMHSASRKCALQKYLLLSIDGIIKDLKNEGTEKNGKRSYNAL